MLLERDDLIERLTTMLAQAERGRGAVVLIGGEAGIGKSTLVRAFAERMARRADVHVGGCDSVVPARPFAPLHDIARRQNALRVALGSADRDRVLEAALELVASGGRPRIVVLEDLHWADAATLDLLRVVGRRVAGLRALVVGTVRDHEVTPDHPLRTALGDLPAGTLTELTVPPLSPAAVSQLARGSGHHPATLYAISGGNPFYVTEVIAVAGGDVPATVRDAVLARLGRLPPAARRAAHAAAVVGQGGEAEVVLRVAECSIDAIAKSVEAGMLTHTAGRVAFRHELARLATLEALNPSTRRELHRRALAALRERSRHAHPATLAHHAVGAGDRPAVVEFASAAGRIASSLGAHREAAAHYSDAIAAADGLDDLSLAKLLEAHARECAVTDDTRSALASQERALACWRRLGDVRGEAECLRFMSFVRWLAGDATGALELARAAVDLIRDIRPPPIELARAEATLAQRLVVNGGDDEAAARHAHRALALATEHSDEAITVHALTTLGIAEVYTRRATGWAKLEESLERARAADLDEDVTRALINLVEAARDMRRYDVADRYGEAALAWLDDHQLDLYRRLLLGRLADIAFERGDWTKAEQLTVGLLANPSTAAQVRTRALALVGRLHARRGDDDPWPALDAAAALVDGRDGQDVASVCLARAEAAWLEGKLADVAREASTVLALYEMEADVTWWWSEAWFWAWRAGADVPPAASVAEPYVLHATGRLRAAADLWHAADRPYERGLALADSAAAADLRTALTIFLELDARPMARVVTAKLRGLGETAIPRGPRAATRHNPHGLTERELEILSLLGDRLRNADIAARLVLSPKTVDHHVSSILRKLGARNRREAAVVGASMRLKDGEVVTAD